MCFPLDISFWCGFQNILFRCGFLEIFIRLVWFPGSISLLWFPWYISLMWFLKYIWLMWFYRVICWGWFRKISSWPESKYILEEFKKFPNSERNLGIREFLGISQINGILSNMFFRRPAPSDALWELSKFLSGIPKISRILRSWEKREISLQTGIRGISPRNLGTSQMSRNLGNFPTVEMWELPKFPSRIWVGYI